MSERKTVHKPRAFITGITGFVGPYLQEALVREGFEVFGMGNTQTGTMVGVSIGDIRDSAFIRSLLEEIQPSHIYHLAGFSSVKKSFQEPQLTREINVGGTQNLMEAVREIVPHAKVLVVSSAEVYGQPQHIPIPEEEVCTGMSPYALSRIEQEELLRQFPDIHWVISRSFNHTGPGQLDTFVIADFCKQVVLIEQGKQEVILHVGNTDVVRDFLDVRDVVQAYILLLQKGRQGSAYNVGSGRGYSLAELLEIILSHSKISIEIRQDPAKMRKVDIPVLIADAAKIRALGWQPALTMENTIRDILTYYRTTL